MDLVALKMLLGDRAKYLGLVFGIGFATLLMSQQVSIFIGLMTRTASQILDVREADVWVMHPRVKYVDELEAMPAIALSRVRGVDGVEWAVPLYKGNAVIRSNEGLLQQVILMGLDDGSLVGRPPEILMGSLSDLKRPDALMIDRAGHEFIWPGEPLRIGRVVEINDRRVEIVAIAKASPPFVTFPVVYTRYSEAIRFTPPQRNKLSFVLVKAREGVEPAALARRIARRTGLQALTWEDFAWRSVRHYMERTGIPINFGITVVLGFIVGAAVAAQTFYIFVLENLRQFGALKAIGISDGQILRMVVLQAFVVGVLGYALGIGLAGAFFYLTRDVPALDGFVLRWQVVVGTAFAVAIILVVSSLASIRKVFVLDPAVVFRG
ncbi:MAG: FtsX-like permease family protein [Deltaproteobacteria bacterium]|nr:FtsX-like permease family protein [Deltaproteobacteria bacterium]